MLVRQRYPFLSVRCVTLVSVDQRVFRLSSSYHMCLLPICLLAFCTLTFLFLVLPSRIKNMLTFLYNGFSDLYGAILPQSPSLAHEHSVRQEQEIYERTTKSTYPNVIIYVLF